MIDDLELLDEYGPQAPPPDAATLHAVRTTLLAEISHRRTVRRPWARTWSWQLPAAGGVALLAASAAIVVVAGLNPSPDRDPIAGPTAPATAPPATSPGSEPAATSTHAPIKLVAATVPEFGYALPGLGEPDFTADPDGPIFAVYRSQTPDSVVLTVGSGPSADAHGTHDIDVGGRPGRILSVPDVTGEIASVQLNWEYRPGTWLTVVTNGGLATEADAVRLAGEVREQRQSLGFKVALGLIPQGWELSGFKDSSLLTYRNPADPDQDVHVQWWPQPPGDQGETEGLEKVTTVRINGRSARLVRAAEFWAVEGGRLPDGSAFRLMAPRSFTADQVLRLAQSVRLLS